MFITGHLPPTGWSVASGQLEEVDTIAGYAARRCDVRGRCQRQDCRRSCHLDYERLLRAGLASLPARKVMAMMRCSRIDGCSLEFREEPGRVIVLRELAGRSYIGVEIRCLGCGARRLTTVEALVHRLKKHGLGDASTPAKGIGKLIRGACSCGARQWAVGFPWHDPNSHVLPLWRQELQKKIDEAGRRRDAQRGLVS